MEELVLIAALGVLALIAMSQCAHHSSRRHDKLYLPPTQRNAAETSHALKHTGNAERTQETTATAVVSERERISNGGRRA